MDGGREAEALEPQGFASGASEKPAVLVTGAFVAMPVLPSVFNFWFVFSLFCSL